jgi:hypothetical protein
MVLVRQALSWACCPRGWWGEPFAVSRSIVVFTCLLALAGCNGGTVDRHALEKDSEAIESLACEGALLADEIANTASTPQFSRVHAGDLKTKASNFADALSERPTDPGIEQEVRQLAAKAGHVADLLGDLETHPNDTQRAESLRTELVHQGGGCS